MGVKEIIVIALAVCFVGSLIVAFRYINMPDKDEPEAKAGQKPAGGQGAAGKRP